MSPKPIEVRVSTAQYVDIIYLVFLDWSLTIIPL